MLIRIAVAVGAMLVASVATSEASASAASGCNPTSGTFDGASWIACASDADAKTTIPIAHAPTNPAIANAPGSSRATPNPSSQAQMKCTYGETDTVDGTLPPATRAAGQADGCSSIAVIRVSRVAGVGDRCGWRCGGVCVAGEVGPPSVCGSDTAVGVRISIRGAGGRLDGTVVGFTTWLWLDGRSPDGIGNRVGGSEFGHGDGPAGVGVV